MGLTLAKLFRGPRTLVAEPVEERQGLPKKRKIPYLWVQNQRMSKKRRTIIKNIWARSPIKIVEINFHWIVESFSLRSQQTGEYIQSPDFVCRENDNTIIWNLKLYPRGTRKSKDWVVVCLCLLDWIDGNSFMTAQYEITLLNHQQRVLKSQHFSFHRNSDESQETGILKNEDLSLEALGHTDELHIHCKIRYELDETPLFGSHFNQDTQQQREDSVQESLASSFQALFNSNMPFSDVQIQVRGTVFPAHKIVISARSPVLRAMFESDGFAENKTNIVKIDDLEPPVVEEMLRFFYTDRVEKMDELAKELLVASDKYLIDSLKSQCQSFLAETINVQNCSELLALADSHSATELKQVAMEFFLDNSTEVAKSSGWQNMERTHPHLGFEVSKALMDQLKICSETQEDDSHFHFYYGEEELNEYAFGNLFFHCRF